jgi:hypothetical protein
MLKYFLGIKVAHSEKGIFISQQKYILDLLKKTRMINCKPYETPIDLKHRLDNDEEGTTTNKGQYFRLAGKLIYLAHIHPNIVFVMSLVNQFMHNLKDSHLQAIYRLSRYLKSTPRKEFYIRSMRI